MYVSDTQHCTAGGQQQALDPTCCGGGAPGTLEVEELLSGHPELEWRPRLVPAFAAGQWRLPG